MSDERKPLPCGMLIVQGGRMTESSIRFLKEGLNMLREYGDGTIIVDGSTTSVEYISFKTGERVELQRDEFAEAIKRGEIKYAVKEENDG